MDWVTLAFYAFSAVAVVSAGAVISVRNPVYAVLCLILTFFSMACIWLLVGAEFLGVTLVLVYVGAVMVLFLFVVMMLDIDTSRLREGWVKYMPLGVIMAVAMLAQMVTLIGVKARSATPFPADNAAAQAAQLQPDLVGQEPVHRVPAAVRVCCGDPDRGGGCCGDADLAQAHRHQVAERRRAVTGESGRPSAHGQNGG